MGSLMDSSIDQLTAQQSSRRMRLGTKSCTECRRRKVRCIYAKGSPVCQACALHDVPCQAQRPKARGTSQEISNESLQRRVQELESLVRRIHDSIDSSPKGTVGPSSEEAPCSSTVGWERPDEIRTDQQIAGNTNRSSAPLAQLLREATLISESDGFLGDDGSQESPSGRQSSPPMQNLNANIPDRQTLESIFTQTKPYWSMWPTCYYGSELHESFQADGQTEGEKYLLKVLGRSSATSLSYCKALLWLALCIQQLSTKWIHDNLPLGTTRQALIESYLKHSTVALAITEGDSIDSVQCHLLQFKLCINMGRPRRAWACTRKAVSSAVALGLHRSGSDPSTYLKVIWTQAWQSERQLSLVLGLPTSVHDPSLMSYDSIPQGLPLPQRIFYNVSIASAQVIARDQDYHNAKYSTTVKIDQDLEDIRKLIPDSWWEPYEPSATLADMYYPEVAKFLYFFLVKLVHLPYMLKSVKERKYDPSRIATLDAAREQIRSYIRLRNFPGAEIVMCELMDFGAFSAGVALILGASYMRNGGGILEPLTEDGSLIQGLIVSLRQTSTLLECRVAEQGAKVLELLTDYRRGESAAVEVSVPYFGQVKVNRSRDPSQSTSPQSAQSLVPITPNSCSGDLGTLKPTNPQYDVINSVHFGTNEFVSSLPPQFGDGLELCEDWFTAMELDGSLQWQETFTTPI